MPEEPEHQHSGAKRDANSSALSNTALAYHNLYFEVSQVHRSQSTAIRLFQSDMRLVGSQTERRRSSTRL